jgi:hypothetical protein
MTRGHLLWQRGTDGNPRRGQRQDDYCARARIMGIQAGQGDQSEGDGSVLLWIERL